MREMYAWIGPSGVTSHAPALPSDGDDGTYLTLGPEPLLLPPPLDAP